MSYRHDERLGVGFGGFLIDNTHHPLLAVVSGSRDLQTCV